VNGFTFNNLELASGIFSCSGGCGHDDGLPLGREPGWGDGLVYRTVGIDIIFWGSF
jgi:hypothetical protein